MLNQFLYSFVTLTAPLAELPVFLSIVQDRTAAELRGAARKVAAGSLAVLTVAALGGRLLLELLGVSLPAFRAVSTLLAIAAATGVVPAILLASRWVSRLVSSRATRMSERFLGLVLVAVGFQMGMTGIHGFLTSMELGAVG